MINNYEERKNKLQEYINKNKVISNRFCENEDSKELYHSFYKHNEFIEDILKDLGYSIEEIIKIKPHPTRGYFNNVENLKNRLEFFVNKNGYFPKKQEIIKVLKIDQRIIDRNGGVNKLKELIDYNTKYDLIDNRGDWNNSKYEVKLANYFIAQGLKDYYLREQYPFPIEEGRYRSDFMFYLDNGKELHVEIWGYNKNTSDSPYKRIDNYNEIRNKKEELYKKYSDRITLISIEAEEVLNQKYSKMEKDLYNIFKDCINLKYNKIDYKLLIPPSKYSNEDLLNECLKYSENKDELPYTRSLPSNIHKEILRRFDAYDKFAKYFGKETKHKYISWNKEMVLDYFKKIADKGLSINKNNLVSNFEEFNYDMIIKYGGMAELKIELFSGYEKNITQEEIKWLQNVANNKGINIKNKVTLEQQNQAKEILDKLSIKQNAS